MKIYQVYCEDYIAKEREERFYCDKENAEKKYRKLCKKYWLTPWYCYANKNWICIMWTDVFLCDAVQKPTQVLFNINN